MGARHSLGNTLSGGFEPGGLIERMKAMIFHSWSEVLMAAPIGGIGACTEGEGDNKDKSGFELAHVGQ